jgi:hypothetical protein
MKLVTIQFPNLVDTSTIPVGAVNVTVSDGTTSIAGGSILAHSEVKDAEPTLAPHTHGVAAQTGGAVT